MNHEFASPGPVIADLRIAGGQINVDAAETQTITVSVEPMDGSSQSREAADQTRVTLEGNRLIVHAPHAKGWQWFRWPKLRIQVRLPEESTITVKAASADVTCNGIFHDVVVQSASGDVFVDRVSKDLSATCASGDVRVGWVGGSLRGHSASGDVMAQHVGQDADLTTASGDIDITRADGSVRGKTASGDIKVGVARQGEVRLHTASGDVSVGIAAGTGVWLDVTTASGRTTSDLNMSHDVIVPPTGTSLKVKVRTASGDIDLRRVVVS